MSPPAARRGSIPSLRSRTNDRVYSRSRLNAELAEHAEPRLDQRNHTTTNTRPQTHDHETHDHEPRETRNTRNATNPAKHTKHDEPTKHTKHGGFQATDGRAQSAVTHAALLSALRNLRRSVVFVLWCFRGYATARVMIAYASHHPLQQ